MSTQWCRLWHDMPTDPKWRTIARASNQPLSAVIAVFTFIMVDASANATERGRTHATDEDVASALDLDELAVAAIRKAMQGRVLDGDWLSGWEVRQPKREDNSAERARAWRETRKEQTQANAAERKRTQRNAPDTDTDTDTESENKKIDNIINLNTTAPREPRPTPVEFPADGSIAYSRWADIVRAERPGVDVDVVAQAFRDWARFKCQPPLDLAASTIEAKFRAFVRRHKVKGIAL